MMMLRPVPVLSRRRFAAGIALSPFALSGTLHHVAARQATPAAEPGVFRYTFGDAVVHVFSTDTWEESISFGASNMTGEERQEVVEEYGALFTLGVNATLVDTGSNIVLLDSGTMPDLTDTLRQVGYEPEDIDVVTFSHLHYDHYLGALTAWGDPAFPNARYILSRVEHDYWMHEDDRPVSAYAAPNMGMARDLAQDIIAKLGDRLELAEWEEEIVPGVRMLPAIGHTGGHSAVEVVSGDETLLHVGDLILNPVLNLEHPEWYIAPAVWQDDDIASRRVLMDRAAEEHLLVQTVHFPFPGVGYVERDGDAWAWLPLA